MKLHELRKIIREVITEVTIKERLRIGDESNLHGDERTQRQFVIDLASQNPMGIISISDIASALNTTRNDIKDTYARLIRYYADRDDFEKIIPEIPFKSSAIYQLVSRSKSAPISKQALEKIKDDEELKYKQTTGVFYPLFVRTPRRSHLLALINLRDSDKIKDYEKLLPPEETIDGEVVSYGILNKKMNSIPSNLQNITIIPKSEFQDYVKKL